MMGTVETRLDSQGLLLTDILAEVIVNRIPLVRREARCSSSEPQAHLKMDRAPAGNRLG